MGVLVVNLGLFRGWIISHLPATEEQYVAHLSDSELWSTPSVFNSSITIGSFCCKDCPERLLVRREVCWPRVTDTSFSPQEGEDPSQDFG